MPETSLTSTLLQSGDVNQMKSTRWEMGMKPLLALNLADPIWLT
jgi:hypothetical protein